MRFPLTDSGDRCQVCRAAAADYFDALAEQHVCEDCKRQREADPGATVKGATIEVYDLDGNRRLLTRKQVRELQEATGGCHIVTETGERITTPAPYEIVASWRVGE